MSPQASAKHVRVELDDPVGLGSVVHILAGESLGAATRQHLDLERHDRAGAVVTIVVPFEVVEMTATFAVGLLGPSVLRHGTIEAFMECYRFEAAQDIRAEIDRGLKLVNLDRSPTLGARLRLTIKNVMNGRR